MSEWQRTVKLGKRDAAEPEVVEAFVEGGASVAPISGKDIPDLVVGFMGVDHLVEVKTDRAKLKPGQKTFAEAWRGAPPAVARNAAQARKLLRMWEVAAAVDEARREVGGGTWAACEDSLAAKGRGA